MEKINFLYCEPDLKSYAGHLFNTAKFLSKELQSIKNINLKFCLDENCDGIIFNKLNGHLVFSQRPNLTIIKSKMLFFKYFFYFNYYIFKGLRKVILNSNQKNIIYFNTAQHLHLLAIFFILVLYSRKIKGCILTFRLTFFFGKKKIKRYYFYYFLFKILSFFKNKIILHTDTKNIYLQLQKITKLKKFLMPIPHLNSYNGKRDKLCISFLGPATKEKKTFDTLCKILISEEISKLRSEICLIIHCFGIEKDRIIKLVSQHRNKLQIHLRLYPLNFNEYYKDLKRSSISIFNYHQSHYENQSSGTFIETIFHNTIPLVSENTWMASVLNDYDLKDLIVNDNNLVKILVSTIKNKKYYAALVENKLIEFKKFHGVKNFVEILKHQITEFE